MKYILFSYDKIKAKTNDKQYIIARCVCDSRNMYNIFMNYDELLEEFCKNNINEDITEFVDYRFYNNSIVPYIKYKI